MTLFELLIAVAIAATLAALLMTVTFRLRSQGESTACVSQLRQIGALVQVAMMENRGYLPSSYHRSPTPSKSSYWFQQIAAAGGAEMLASLRTPGNLFMCPGTKRRWPLEQGRYYGNYGWNIHAANEWREGETQPYLNRYQRNQLDASKVVIIADAGQGAYAEEQITHWFSDRNHLGPRHFSDTKVNLLFLDTSVRTLPLREITPALLAVRPI